MHRPVVLTLIFLGSLTLAPTFAYGQVIPPPSNPPPMGLSVDLNSPGVTSSPPLFSAADIIVVDSTLPIAVGMTQTELGLGSVQNADINGHSNGYDDFPDSIDVALRNLLVYFSVSPGSKGDTQNAVWSAWNNGTEPGSVFAVRVVNGVPLPPAGAKSYPGGLEYGTNINAISQVLAETYPVYITMDPPTAAACSKEPFIVYKVSEGGGISIQRIVGGLGPGDDIDAFALDANTNTVIFSLAPGSPALLTPNPENGNSPYTGAYLFIFPTPQGMSPIPGREFAKWAGPSDLGLNENDDINGLIVVDPLLPAGPGTTPKDYPIPALTINGGGGSLGRVVSVSPTDTVDVALKPVFGEEADFILYAQLRNEPLTSEEHFHGILAFSPCPFDPPGNTFVLASSLESGCSVVFGTVDSAPWTQQINPGQLGMLQPGQMVYLQALMLETVVEPGDLSYSSNCVGLRVVYDEPEK